MIFFRKRLFFWLINAYIKKWGKRFFLFFLIGLLIFFILIKYTSNLLSKIPSGSHESIGIVGDYKIDTLPKIVLEKLSSGLTTLSEDGTPIEGLAQSWKILDNGKTYEFKLRDNLFFADGTKFDSSKLDYNFTDATIKKPDSNTIQFTLKDTYSPFLVTVSRPVFKKGFIGVSNYKVKTIDTNGDFIKSITIVSTKNSFQTITYNFYPSADALKLAFLLGEVQIAKGLSDTWYKDSSLDTFSNVESTQVTNYSRLVTLFYNTKDSILSDEKIRNALSYAIPDSFSKGQRNSTPFFPQSWVYKESIIPQRQQDLDHASLLLKGSSASNSANFTLTIKVIPKYKKTAEKIAEEWKKIEVITKIEEVDIVPEQYQIFLGDFVLSKDPDQYTLWHSGQGQNITHYMSLRIDKLLEDGRKTTDITKRKKIYEDFQKYLLADSPASFLYFPYEYDIKRK